MPVVVTIFSPAWNALPDMILTISVFGSPAALISAIVLTTAIVPEVEPLIVLPLKFDSVTAAPE